MDRKERDKKYIELLERELVPAMGCTEPIALAYCAAKARELLGEKPVKLHLRASGNIIKNVKSVVVPNSGGARGMKVAVALGALFGDAGKELQVISGVSEEEALKLASEMEKTEIIAESLDSGHVLDMIITAYGKEHSARVRICDSHTNVVLLQRDDEIIFKAEEKEPEKVEKVDLTIEEIFDFANTVELDRVEKTISRQMEYNMAIAKTGLREKYGAAIGYTILKDSADIKTKAKAYAAAASDARMGGCELPVVINSGSGNQGITVSVPVMVYADHFGRTREETVRALLVSNLVSLHLKSGIGRLSAYCGAISAGVGAGAGIAYLLTGDLETVNHTIVNGIAIASGMVCDGAKASCAAKIAVAVESGILGYEMYESGNQFWAGEGLVVKGVENTISNISRVAQEGMKETDSVIIEIMTSN